jgi:hypothetical protein
LDPLEKILREHGPTRSARLAEFLSKEFNMATATARKRISRVKTPIRRFKVPLLPKRESFLYCENQRGTEIFWDNLLRDLRETNSIYGVALDGLASRGGIVPVDEFSVISGAPLALKRQVSSSRVANSLLKAGAIEQSEVEYLGMCYFLRPWQHSRVDISFARARLTAESIILDGLREWARKLGLASYDKIAIRGENHPRQIGQFKWDLTGPSYLLPLRRGDAAHGFLAADVFAEGILKLPSIKFFIRKTQLLKATSNSGDLLPLLVAEGFTGEALSAGHAAGIVLATPSNLFGHKVGDALKSLLTTLQNAAAVAAANPERLASLINDLSEIEGAALNLRGVLFELIVAYLAKFDGSSVDVGVSAYDPDTGKTADIDVLKVLGKAECTAIECKGKRPGGTVELREVDKWLNRVPIFCKYLQSQQRFRETKISLELWTSGIFSDDAIARLNHEKQHRTRTSIDWKDGRAVRELANKAKEKAIGKALDEHFLKHPLAS